MRIIAAFLLIVACTTGVRADDAVQAFELDNGMKVLVREDHRAPVVVSMVWYRIGSSYEYEGITGISHVLEHMMFKGTENLEPGEFSKIVAANGGKENAFTSRDYTAYFQQIAADRLELVMELEADRMRNLRLLPEEFQKEREVVKEERRLRTEDKPTAFFYERFNATSFITSPYRNPVIGWMDDLNALTLEDLEQWYARWYAPNNATLIVVGDVEAAEVLRLAKKYFGPLEPSEIAPPKPRREVPHKGLRRIEVELPAKNPLLIMAYKTPVLTTAEVPWEAYALEVLASILDGGQSARFPQHLIRGAEVATSAGAGYSLNQRLDTMFVFDGIPANGKTIPELEAAIRVEIARVQDELVEEKELARVKAQVIADKVYDRDSMMNMAIQMGVAESVGLGWEKIDEYVGAIESVTPEQVRAVARKYLVDDQLTVGVLVPKEDKLIAGRAP
jgi:zinc protease